MNSFDAVVYVGLGVAAVAGFNAGLLRSAVTILAYLIAMPIAVWLMSLISPGIDGKPRPLLTQNSLLSFGIFFDCRHGARQAVANGYRRGDRHRGRHW
jgi:membrane protein required for colicin V production